MYLIYGGIKMQCSVLNEFADLFPINLKSYGTILGVNVYSNENIVNFVKGWVGRSPITKKISKKIKEGIDRKQIIIGYEDTNKLKFILGRIKEFWKISDHKYILGYYSHLDEKLAIILDRNTSFFGKAIRDLPPILTHELCHMVAHIDTNNFLKYNMKDYILPFYSYSLSAICGKKIPSKLIVETATDLAKTFERNWEIPENPVIVAKHMWIPCFSRVETTDQATIHATQIMEPYRKYIYSGENTDESVVRNVVTEMVKAYREIGLKDVLSYTIPCQEFLFCSEIICVTNQFKVRPPMIKLINSINFKGPK